MNKEALLIFNPDTKRFYIYCGNEYYYNFLSIDESIPLFLYLAAKAEAGQSKNIFSKIKGNIIYLLNMMYYKWHTVKN